MKVTERFTRLGEKTIDYRVTIDDSKVYSTVDGGVAAEP